jgi:hypothetical protein
MLGLTAAGLAVDLAIGDFAGIALPFDLLADALTDGFVDFTLAF